MDTARKLKHDTLGLGALPFLMLWIVGHIGAWMLAVGANKFLTWLQIYIQDDFQFVMLMALGTGIPTALVQMVMVERGLRKSMRGWLPVSMLGWGLSGLAFYSLWMQTRDILFVIASDVTREFFARFFFVPFFVPVAIVQWLWLRRKVKSASLWMLAAFTSALLFSLSRSDIPYTFTSWWYVGYAALAGAALFYSAVTGATMLYLWTQPSQKAKNESAQTQTSDEDKRVARLSEGNGTDTLGSEHQTQAREAKTSS